MYVSAILVAAGLGKRFRSKVPKPLVRLGGIPLILFSLKRLNAQAQIKEIVVVVNSLNQDQIIKLIRKHSVAKAKKVVLGGRLRQDSVFNGLREIDAESQFVLIHDAARPFVTDKDLFGLIKEARNSHAAILGVPVKATIKKVTRSEGQKVTRKLVVDRTLKRDSLWEIQTPQVFSKDLILRAYKRFRHCPVTDDAMLVERLGVKVSIVRGDYQNIKVTTPEDLLLAEAIANDFK